MANGIKYNFVSRSIDITKNNNKTFTADSASISCSLLLGNNNISTPIYFLTSSENLQNYQNIHKFIINNNIQNINLYNPSLKNGKEIILFNKGNSVTLNTNKYFNELQILTGSIEVVNSGDYFGQSISANDNFSKLIVGSQYDEKVSLPMVTANALSLLLNMNDVSGSTVFVDSSPNNFSITRTGNTVLTSSESKFGGYSAFFDGNGDALTIINGNTIAFGNSDFTIETWVYNKGNGQVNIFETRNGSEGSYPVLGIGSDAKFYWYLNNNYVIVSDVSELNTWVHVAVSRKNNVTKMFLNGTQSGNSYNDNNSYVFPRLLIGTYNFGAAGSFYGYLDDFRILKGVALYTSSFLPPTASFTSNDAENFYSYYNSGPQTGLAYIFNSSSNGYALEQVLSGAYATDESDEFGYSVSMNSAGDKVAIGARYDESANSSEGLAYIFTSGSNGWFNEAILKGSRVETSDNFGTCLKINNSGNLLAVGSPNDEQSFTVASAGLVYIFRSSSIGWNEEAILNASNSTAGGGPDYFGSSLDFNEEANRLFVGAPADETAEASAYFGAGLVYVFNSSSGGVGWISAGYISSDISLNSKVLNFGNQVSCDGTGNKVLISSNKTNGWTDYPTTLCYLYTLRSGQWVLEQRFSGSKVNGDDTQNNLVKLNYSGNMAFIGSYNSEISELLNSTGNNSSGLVYNFASGSSGWVLNTIIYGSCAYETNDYFGSNLFCNKEGNKLLVGAINDEITSSITSNGGLTYIFEVENNYPNSADYYIDNNLYYILPTSSSATFISYRNSWYKF